MWRRATTEGGVALVVAVLSLSLLSCLGLALVLVTITETAIAGSHLQAAQTFYAAEAAVASAVQELGALPDWEEVLAGDVVSTFVDPAVLNMVSPDDERRAWMLFAYGRLDALMPPGPMRSPFVLAVWIAAAEPPDAAIAVLGRAYGASGSRRAIEVVAARSAVEGGRPRIVAWREVR